MTRVLTICSLLIACIGTQAQTNNSPYSLLGIGDLEDSYFNRTNGLSSTGVAYRSSRNLIENNPASLSALDNQFFIGELGIRGKYISYSGAPVDPSANTSFDMTFRRFAFGTRIGKHWGSSVGLAPFSSENYEFNAPQEIQGTNGQTANAYYEGFGGLNRVYWSNAYDFFHHVSLGLRASYIFGSINQKVILQNPAVAAAYVSTNKNIFISNFYLDYGLQLYGKLGKSWEYSIGGTFANKQDMIADYTVEILGPDSSLLHSETTKEDYFTLPNTYGMGISLTKDRRYTFLADYKYQQWNQLNYHGFNYALQDSRRVSVGFEVSKKQNIYNTQVETSYIQGGLYYGESYLNVYGQQITDYGATVGFGINSKRTPFNYNISLQYGIRGKNADQLVRENYFSVNFVLGYRDFWFTRGKRFN